MYLGWDRMYSTTQTSKILALTISQWSRMFHYLWVVRPLLSFAFTPFLSLNLLSYSITREMAVQCLAYGMFKCLDKNPSETSQAKPGVFCLDPIVDFYFDPVFLGTKRRKLSTSQRLSMDACFQAVPWTVHLWEFRVYAPSRQGEVFVLLLEEIVLCSSLWNFQVPSSRQALASGFALHLQCEGLHVPTPPPSLSTRKTSSDRRVGVARLVKVGQVIFSGLY